METYNKPISVVAPAGEAIDKTKILLFKPFNLEKWFIIGFCAWLANLLHQGFRLPNLNFHNPQHSPECDKIGGCVRENLLLVGIIGAIVIVIFITIALVLLWLNSRGHFMFLDCLAKNRAQVVEPWKNFKKQANSLFCFRLLLGLAGTFIITALVVPIIFLSILFHSKGTNLAAYIGTICLIALFVIIAALFFGIIRVLTLDFVVPIMYLNKIKAIAAWKKYLSILGGYFWKTVLYLLFKFVLSIAISAIEVGIFLAGCCLCCISTILLIPYIGTVILLPFSCFMRLYTLCFLKQFGTEYDVFV